jgi:hypothetical protein
MGISKARFLLSNTSETNGVLEMATPKINFASRCAVADPMVFHPDRAGSALLSHRHRKPDADGAKMP